MINLTSWIVFISKVLLSNFGLLSSPFRYTLVVTKKCKSRCINCKIWKEPADAEMTLDDFQKIAKAAGKNLCWLNITGGEPTDRSDLPEIIQVFKANCPNLIFVNFSTNGLRPDHIEKAVLEIAALKIPVFAVNVSLDGPRAVNDHLRGVKGSFDQVIETYRRLRNLKSVKSMLAMTLYETNFSVIDETYQQMNKIFPGFRKSDLHFNLAHQSEHHYGNHNEDPAPYPKVELLSAVKKFTRSSGFNFSPLSFVERTYLNNFAKYFRTGKTPVQCAALMSSVYISEKGDMYPCTIWNKNLGSLLGENQSVDALLAGNEGKALRKDIKQSKCDNCWSPCEAFPSILANLF